MTEFLTNFFNDDDFLGFGLRPLSIRFNTPLTKDISPMAPWKKDDQGNYYTVVRVVGLNPEQTEVSLESYGLLIKGESETFGEKYSQELKLGVSSETIANIKTINYEVKNGMCKITLVMKEKKSSDIKINRV